MQRFLNICGLQTPNGPLKKKRYNKYSKVGFNHRSSNRDVCKAPLNPFEMSDQSLLTI